MDRPILSMKMDELISYSDRLDHRIEIRESKWNVMNRGEVPYSSMLLIVKACVISFSSGSTGITRVTPIQVAAQK